MKVYADIAILHHKPMKHWTYTRRCQEGDYYEAEIFPSWRSWKMSDGLGVQMDRTVIFFNTCEVSGLSCTAVRAYELFHSSVCSQPPPWHAWTAVSPRLRLICHPAFASHLPAQPRDCALLEKALPAQWSPSAPGLPSLIEQLCCCCSLAVSAALPEPWILLPSKKMCHQWWWKGVILTLPSRLSIWPHEKKLLQRIGWPLSLTGWKNFFFNWSFCKVQNWHNKMSPSHGIQTKFYGTEQLHF